MRKVSARDNKFEAYKFSLGVSKVEELQKILDRVDVEHVTISLIQSDTIVNTDSITAGILYQSLTPNNVVIALMYKVAGPFFTYSCKFPIWMNAYTINKDWAAIIAIMFNKIPELEILKHGETKILVHSTS